MNDRRELHAVVSSDAHDRWHDAAATWGVSVTAVLEVLARRLNTDTIAEGEVLPIDEGLVREARTVDAQRRNRARARGRPVDT